MTIRIVTDSTCDLPANVIEELGITVIPLFINIGDKGYLDGVDITRKEFYTNLPDYELIPPPAPPDLDAFHTPSISWQTKALPRSSRSTSRRVSAPRSRWPRPPPANTTVSR